MAYLDYNGLSAVKECLDHMYLRESNLSFRLDPIDGTVSINRLAAADETAASVLSAFNTNVNLRTPDEMGVFHPGAGFIEMAYAIASRLYLAWMCNGVLEIGLVRLSVDVQTRAITYSALGHTSTAYGVAEVDTAWTVEELPNDAPYELPPATASTLGGVKVGNGLSVTSDGTLSPNLDYAASPTSGGNAIKSNGILYGAVDSTSTSTVFTATVDGLTALYDGACVMLRNGVVTSASGWTLNVNGLGAKPVYSNMGAQTRESTLFNTNYTMLFVYDSDRIEGGCWMLYRGYYSDANSIGYQLRTNSSTLPAQAKFYRYRLLFTSADGTHWVPANTSTSTSADTAKTPNSTTPIDPLGPISYYGTTSAVNANANVGSGYQWQQYAINLGYSFNATSSALTLDYPKPVYVKCHPLANGSATIDATTPYTQALPFTADGCIYIYLGRAYSATNIELVAHHPVYWHDGTGIRLWTGAEPVTYTAGDGIAITNGVISLDLDDADGVSY